MKLSIITINRNNAEGLRRTLASVVAQTYHEIEHVIIDGASTDESVEVIKEYEHSVFSNQESAYSIIWVSEKDNGIYHAMNKGIKRATGDYVWILNSGDCAVDESAIAQMMASLNEIKTKVPILMGNIVQVYPDGRRVREAKHKVCKGAIPQSVDSSMLTFYRATIPQDAAFVRRDLFEQYGYFDETMKICADWKLYLDMIALGGVVPMYVDVDVVLFDMSGVSNVNHERRLAERRAYLEKILPPSVLKDYDAYANDITIMQRLHRHPWAFCLTRLLERILFKMEKLKKC